MKKRFVVTAWAVLLTIVLLLAACGPAQSEADATAEAGGATTTTTDEAAGEETTDSTDLEEVPAGIPTVEGPTTTTDSGLVYIETQAGDGRTPEEGDIVTMNIVGMLDDGTA